jgi:hypothetical protein
MDDQRQLKTQMGQNLIADLRELVEDYLAKHKNISLHGLSKKCGVASSTLRRIVSGETKEEPRGATVLGILVAITKETNVQKLIERFPGSIADCLQRTYENIIGPSHSSHVNLADFLRDPLAYIVYKMAANVSGVKLEELIQLLGVTVEETVSEMKEVDLLFEEAGFIHAHNKNFTLPPSIYRRHINELVRFTKFGSKYVDGSLFINYSESVSPAAYGQVKGVLVKAMQEVRAILSKKENYGEVPFFMTSILDTMEVEGNEESQGLDDFDDRDRR